MEVFRNIQILLLQNDNQRNDDRTHTEICADAHSSHLARKTDGGSG